MDRLSRIVASIAGEEAAAAEAAAAIAAQPDHANEDDPEGDSKKLHSL